MCERSRGVQEIAILARSEKDEYRCSWGQSVQLQ